MTYATRFMTSKPWASPWAKTWPMPAPSAVEELGVQGAIKHLQDILSGAIASIPSCPGEGQLAQLVRLYAERMTPRRARAGVTP